MEGAHPIPPSAPFPLHRLLAYYLDKSAYRDSCTRLGCRCILHPRAGAQETRTSLERGCGVTWEILGRRSPPAVYHRFVAIGSFYAYSATRRPNNRKDFAPLGRVIGQPLLSPSLSLLPLSLYFILSRYCVHVLCDAGRDRNFHRSKRFNAARCRFPIRSPIVPSLISSFLFLRSCYVDTWQQAAEGTDFRGSYLLLSPRTEITNR